METNNSLPKKYCSNCGTKIDSDSQRFCVQCGNTLYEINYNSPKNTADSSLTKNIVLIGLSMFLFFMAAVISICVLSSVDMQFQTNQDNVNIPSSTIVFLEIIATIMIYYATKPSYDHIDSPSMQSLKEVEMALAFLPTLIIAGASEKYFIVVIISQSISIVLPAIYIKRHKKIPKERRCTRESVVLAWSIIFLVIDGLYIFGYFVGLLSNI